MVQPVSSLRTAAGLDGPQDRALVHLGGEGGGCEVIGHQLLAVACRCLALQAASLAGCG